MDVETESKWGVAIKAMGTDPLGSKIVKEVDRAGCCYPPFLCVIDKNTVKYARDRSYLWVQAWVAMTAHDAPMIANMDR